MFTEINLTGCNCDLNKYTLDFFTINMYLSCSFYVYAFFMFCLNQNGSNIRSPPFALAVNHCIKVRGK